MRTSRILTIWAIRCWASLTLISTECAAMAQSNLADYLHAHPWNPEISGSLLILEPERARSNGPATSWGSFSRKLATVGALKTIVPNTMIVIDDTLADEPNVYEGLPGQAKVLYLLRSLSWRPHEHWAHRAIPSRRQTRARFSVVPGHQDPLCGEFSKDPERDPCWDCPLIELYWRCPLRLKVSLVPKYLLWNAEFTFKVTIEFSNVRPYAFGEQSGGTACALGPKRDVFVGFRVLATDADNPQPMFFTTIDSRDRLGVQCGHLSPLRGSCIEARSFGTVGVVPVHTVPDEGDNPLVYQYKHIDRCALGDPPETLFHVEMLCGTKYGLVNDEGVVKARPK